jgi:hypothetical protein
MPDAAAFDSTPDDDAVLWLPADADALAWRAPLEPAAAADLRRRLALPSGR